MHACRDKVKNTSLTGSVIPDSILPLFLLSPYPLRLRLNGDRDPHRILEDPVVTKIAEHKQRSPAQVRHGCPQNMTGPSRLSKPG